MSDSEVSEQRIPEEIVVQFENQEFKIFSKSRENPENVLISFHNFKGTAVNIDVGKNEEREGTGSANDYENDGGENGIGGSRQDDFEGKEEALNEDMHSAAASTLLFNSQFYFTLLEVKKRLNITGRDVVVCFPDLEIFSVHEDDPLLLDLTVKDLIDFLEAHCAKQNIPLPAHLTITLEALPNCTKSRVAHLFSLLRSGGLPTNPILIDDSTDEVSSEDLLNGADETSLDMDDQQEFQVQDGDDHEVSSKIDLAAVEDTHDKFVVSVDNVDTDKVPVAHPVSSDLAPVDLASPAIDQARNQVAVAVAGYASVDIDTTAESAASVSAKDDDDDLFTEEDEEEAVERERFLLEGASAATAANDDLILVEENEEDYLSSSNATLAPLLQKLKSTQPSFSPMKPAALSDDSAAFEIDENVAQTINTIEQDLIAVDSTAKRELLIGQEEDIAMGTPSKKIRVI